jgi:CheY-like chemotaxis protein
MRRAFRRYEDRVTVEVHSDALSALVRIGAWQPDLVVVDIFRPVVDGIEICRRLSQSPETADVAVVVTSARMTAELASAAKAAGAWRVSPKPIRVHDIVALALVAHDRPERPR